VKQQFSGIRVATPEVLAEADGLIFGIPTRFGSASSQMQQFFDTTGGLWASGALIGKPAGVMTSSAMQHGGQEATILSAHVTLLHHGMVIVGLPASFTGLGGIEEVSGAEVELFRVQETLTDEILARMGALEAKQQLTTAERPSVRACRGPLHPALTHTA